MRNHRLGLIAIVVILVTVAAAGPASAAVSPILCIVASRPAAGGQPAGGGQQAPAVTILAQPGQAYLHTGTVGNTSGESTYLDNPALNGQIGTKLFTVQNEMPYGFGCPAVDTAQGVWYSPFAGRWAVYNEDQSSMPTALNWNVFVPPQDGTVIVHDSGSATVAGPLTHIDDPQFNGDPSAVIFVQHVYNPILPGASAAQPAAPGGVPGDLYTHTVAATYDAGAGKWAIRNTDGSAFPSGITFNVLKASPDESYFTQIVTAANQTVAYGTYLDSPLLDNNPDALILVTQLYQPGHVDNHRVGVRYDGIAHGWLLFNLDHQSMPLGAAFNVLVIPPKAGFFVQTTTGANTLLNGTSLNNPNLNNNPDALIYITQDWNPPDSPLGIGGTHTFDDHPIGVTYKLGVWSIINTDYVAMPLGASFNVYYTWPRGNSFSVSASAYNASGSSLTISSPLLNGDPAEVPIASFNATPAGLPGGHYTAPVGLRYYSPLGAWQIFNNSGPTFAITQTYNVLVPPGNTFSVTSTSTLENWFDIDNPLTNNDPWALVFVTRLDDGGLNPHNIGVWYDTFSDRWSIFNEDVAPMAAGTAYDVFVIKRSFVFLPLVQR